MTTNVKISTDYVHPGKVLRIRSVDPKNEATVYRDLTVSPQKLVDHGGSYTCEFLYVHDGSKLIVEECDAVTAAQDEDDAAEPTPAAEQSARAVPLGGESI